MRQAQRQRSDRRQSGGDLANRLVRLGVVVAVGIAISALQLSFRTPVAFAPAALAQDPSGTVAQSGSSSPFGRTDPPIVGSATGIDTKQPLYLQGDELIYDSKGERVTARGNVEITFNNYVLKADQVVYDQSANTLSASGNVVLVDPNGGVTRTERMTLTDDFRDGFIQSLSVVGKDETRIVARRAVRRDGNVTEFEQGKFTPCKHDEGKPPLWCISAERVIHDREATTITYLDAAFEVWGMPLLYFPYLQTPDPTVKRRSGFLLPRTISSKTLGYGVEVPYYFALSPSYDFTLHPMYTAKQGVLWKGFWRQKLAFGSIRGEYNLRIAAINQKHEDLPNSVRVEDPDESLDGWRGSVQTRGDFSLASWWRFGWDVTFESDDSFRRFYKLDTINTTNRVNTVFLTGLSDRNFFEVRGYHFGGLMPLDTDHAESRVHPIVDWNYVVGAPVLGGELSWNVNAYSLSRDLAFKDAGGVDHDVMTKSNRVVADVNWRRRFIDPFGITYTPFANLRGDALSYDQAFDPVGNTLINDETVTRGVASAGILASYPWLARSQTASHVVEPIAQIIGRTGKVRQTNLPNEDARSIVFDDTNLFALAKTSGLDRIETGTRANVGVQYTFQANSGGYARLLLGQSFHISGENIYAQPSGNEPSSSPGTNCQLEPSERENCPPNILNERNGLATNRSDYVVGAYLAPWRSFLLVGKARLNHQDLTLRRADVTASYGYGPLSLQTLYTFAASDPLNNDTRDQQELVNTGTLQLAEHWSLLGSLRYDIDASSFRSSMVGLQYSDECFILTASYTETNTSTKDVPADRTVMLYFALKHIGEFNYQTDKLGGLFSDEQR